MGIILPYDDKIAESDGGFFTPDGEFIDTACGGHEEIAEDICRGDYFDKISDFLWRYEDGELNYKSEPEWYMKLCNISKIEDLDRFSTSHLSGELLESYKMYYYKIMETDELDYLGIQLGKMDTDFLVRFGHYDQLHTLKRQSFTTTYPWIYSRFFNWMLMGWNVDLVTLGYFDKETGTVLFDDPYRFKEAGWIKEMEFNQKCKEELKQIKNEGIPYIKRMEFFKK